MEEDEDEDDDDDEEEEDGAEDAKVSTVKNMHLCHMHAV